MKHPWAINAVGSLLVAAALEVRANTLPSWLQVSGRVYGLAIVDTGGGPRQRPETVGTLEMEATPSRAWRGVLELRGRAGGPFEGGPGPAVYNFEQTFQNYSPSLEVRHAYVEWRGSNAEVRAGVQTFAWGKLDGVPPTDVVNPRDWHDPLVVDEFFEEQKIGIPALMGTYYLPDVPRLDLRGLRLALAWIPFAVPPRLPLALERWFPPTINGVNLNPCVPVPAVPPERGCPQNTVRVRADFGTENVSPPRQLDAGGIAARLGGTWRNADFDLYHYTGPETGPDGFLSIVAFNKGTPNDLNDLDVRAAVRLKQKHDVMHMTGADVAVPLGPFTIRAEAAWFVNHAYLRPSTDVVAPLLEGNIPADLIGRIVSGKRTAVPVGPLFPLLDTVEWGIGADTIWRGFQPLLQLNQILPLGSAPRLLISDPETRLSGAIRRRFARDRLEVEARGLWEIEKGALYLFPRVSYQLRESMWLRAGYLVLTGPRNSVLGEFRANDELVLQARMTF